MSQLVSEGYAPEGRVFEMPQANRDNEKPRYLAFIGSLVDPEIARSRWWTKGGGIEVTSPCLRYVKNFVRKGRITPLLKDTHDFLPYDYVNKMIGTNPFGAGYFSQPIPPGYVPPDLPPSQGQHQAGFGTIAVGGPSPYGSLVGKIALPGEQIHAILTGPENLTQTNIQRGIVELTSLQGYDYRPQQIDEVYVDPEIWRMQKAIFPNYPTLPVLLDEMEQLLDDAESHTDLRPIVTEMHDSLIQFRDYADATIQNAHHTMRESAGRRGYVFRYTSMDLVLLEQLGMQRQDRQIRQEVQTGGGIQKSELVEILAAFQQSNREERDALIQVLRGPVVDEHTMMAGDPGAPGQDGTSGTSGYSGQVLTNETPAGQSQMAESLADSVTLAPAGETADVPQKFICACGKEAASLAGLKAHERSCTKAPQSNV